MYKKLFFATLVAVSMFVCGASFAVQPGKEAGKNKSAEVVSEDDKYAQTYEKCTKEAGANEAKYDQIFNTCMDKNGFPQEEYDTGGQPMQDIESQDN